MSEGKKRLVQFELLRVAAMLGILMNHVFNYGLHIYDDFTLDVSSSGNFLLWSVLQIMKLIALPSVNCYSKEFGKFGALHGSMLCPFIFSRQQSVFVLSIGANC